MRCGFKELFRVVKLEYHVHGKKDVYVIFNFAMGTRTLTFFCREFLICGPVDDWLGYVMQHYSH